MPWTDATTPLDPGTSFGGCWADDLAEFIAAGQDAGLTEALISSADAINWIYRASPFDGGVGNGAIRDLFHGVYVAVGNSPDFSDAVLTSPDNATWAGSGNPFLSGGEATSVAVRDSDDAILAAGGNFGSIVSKQFALSTDNAATWATAGPFAACFGQSYPGVAVAVRASDDLILLVVEIDLCHSGIAATSTDGGATWTLRAPFNGSGFGCAIRASDGALIVGGYDGHGVVSVSLNDGATWSAYHPFGTSGISEVKGVAVRASDGALVAVGKNFGTGLAEIAVSTNSGVTWTTHSPFGATVGSDANGVFVRASDDAILVAGYDNGTHQLAISTDGGTTWTSYAPFGGGAGRSVAVRASDGLVVVVENGGGSPSVATSADGGTTWTTYSPFVGDGGAASVVIRASDGALIIGGSDSKGFQQVLLSTDDGATWSASDANPFEVPAGSGFCAACKQSTGALVVGANNFIPFPLAISSDGGATLMPVSSPFDHGGVFAIAYSPSEDLWMAAGYNGGEIATVAVSSDDGATWTAIVTHPMDSSTSGFAPRVYRDEVTGNWWLLGQTTGGNALAVSNDSGATWTEIATPLDPVAGDGGAYAMVRTDGGLALGGIDALSTVQMCVSSDDGQTWDLDADPAPFDAGTCYALAYSPAHNLAVAFGAG